MKKDKTSNLNTSWEVFLVINVTPDTRFMAEKLENFIALLFVRWKK
jgi:hypothetical protein